MQSKSFPAFYRLSGRSGSGASALLVFLSLAACTKSSITGSIFSNVDGTTIVAIADGDFRASTYSDQKLAEHDHAFTDRLVVWRRGVATPSLLPVSNSVTSPPEVLAVSPDGHVAYVVERLGQRAPGDTRVADLPDGGRLTAVRLDGGGVRSTVDFGPFPEAIDLRADGRMIAAVSNSAERSLVHLVPVASEKLGQVQSFDLADLGIAGTSGQPRGGVTATSVFWRPGSNVLAVTINTKNLVAFFKVEASPTGYRLVPWGAPVETGRDPFTGRFTPDGRYFLTLDWGRDLAAPTLEGRLPSIPSRISVIRLAEQNDKTVTHRRIGGAPTDLSSEGIAISPDGTLVAAISMRGTVLPPQSVRHTPTASVVLLHYDAQTGSLTPVHRVTFPAVLPEGAAFDRSGRALLVTSFERPGRAGGAIHIFDVKGVGSAAKLVGTKSVSAPNGIHHVVVR